MNRIVLLLATVTLIAAFSTHAAKLELEFKGQKQIVEFDPNNPKDLDRVERLWMKADHMDQKVFYVYSETGGFQVCEEPRNDSKCKVYGGWYQQLSTSNVTSPYFVSVVWDKTKWYPRGHLPGYGWLKLDDSNLIWPSQLEPAKEWAIRYLASYRGTDTAAAEAGITPKYDEYTRWHFDREGFVLDNRTMRRKKIGDNFLRVFQYRNFVKVTAVSPKEIDVAVSKEGGLGLSFNIKEALASPKIEYDKDSGFISAWAGFDDPPKPILDKNNGNACVADCKSRKRWEP